MKAVTDVKNSVVGGGSAGPKIGKIISQARYRGLAAGQTSLSAHIIGQINSR